MRIVMAPEGSRGDFQPMLALAVGLRAAGHDVVVLTSPNFVPEVEAFGLTAASVGIDIEAHVRAVGRELSTEQMGLALMKLARSRIGEVIHEMLPLARGAELVIGSGTQLVAGTVAEAVGAPYAFFAYSPQFLRSSRYPPMTFSRLRLPRVLNWLLWQLGLVITHALFGRRINVQRRALGLAAVRDWYRHLFAPDRFLLAADPELAPLAPELARTHRPFGALHLHDARPLPEALTQFLASGPPPIYVGFGSMPDADPDATTTMVLAAARRAGARLVLSSGWAGLGRGLRGDDVLVIGPVSHHLLFPRVAAVVHHGGSGTTSAALRAGRVQIVVPHALDQFQSGRWVHEAGVGPAHIARSELSVARLTQAMVAVLGDRRYDERAHTLAGAVTARDPIASAVAAVEGMGRR